MPLMHYDGRDMQADHVLTAAQGGPDHDRTATVDHILDPILGGWIEGVGVHWWPC